MTLKMITAQVIQKSVTNILFQGYSYPDDYTIQTTIVIILNLQQISVQCLCIDSSFSEGTADQTVKYPISILFPYLKKL